MESWVDIKNTKDEIQSRKAVTEGCIKRLEDYFERLYLVKLKYKRIEKNERNIL